MRRGTGHRSHLIRTGIATALVVAGLCGLASQRRTERQGATEPFPCDVQTTERIVAIGDVHGAHDAFVSILKAAGLIDGRGRWSGGKAVLVQTGDILDRGPDSRKSLDLLRRLEREARRAGGRVHALLGNHEWMRLSSDWRYVSQGEFEAFRTPDSAGLRERAVSVLGADAERQARAAGQPFDPAAYREQLFKAFPLGGLEMRAAFDAGGEYGAWLRARPAVARINGIVFLHGGISADDAPRGCEGIDAAIRENLAALPVPADRLAMLLAARESGPLWYRGLAIDAETALEPIIDGILKGMRARAIVIGHTTVPGRIQPRLGGRVIQIDTGMLDGEFFPGGAPAALEITGGTLTAVYLDRREPLPALARPATAVAATHGLKPVGYVGKRSVDLK